jgi:hypothetical protein
MENHRQHDGDDPEQGFSYNRQVQKGVPPANGRLSVFLCETAKKGATLNRCPTPSIEGSMHMRTVTLHYNHIDPV